MSHRVGIRDRDTKRLYNSSTRHSGPDPMSSLAQATSKEKAYWMPDLVRHDERHLILPQFHQSLHLSQFHPSRHSGAALLRHSGLDPESGKYLIIPDVVCACEDNSAHAIASALKCQGICRSDGIKFYHCRHTIHATDPVHRIDRLLIQAERGGQGYA